jgi:hypothetical protein
LAVASVEAIARVSAGAAGIGVGSMAVVALAVASLCRVTVCALTVDFGDDVSAFWSEVVCPSVVVSDSPASSLVDAAELEGCGSGESGNSAEGPAEDPELADDDVSEEPD